MIAHKVPHQSFQSTVNKIYSQISKAISLRFARQRKRLKASAFKNALERHTNNYAEQNAIGLNDETSHRKTYETTNEGTNTAAWKALSQSFLQVCDLCHEHYCNDFMSTLC